LQSTAPSSYLVTVAATDSNDARASFSNYGSFIDIAAPGVQVKTTLKGGGYGWGTGTSFSTPVIAGAYALMMAANPGLSPAQLDSVLFSTAADLGTAGYDKYFGYGRVNAAAAVTRARSSGSSGDTISPTAAVSSPSAGAKVAGIVAVNASASDNVGVTKVELYVRGTLMATDLTSPYAFSWNTAGMTDGSATLQAKAYDAAGNYTLSAALSVTIANDSTAPVVSIASPVSGARVNGTVSISATATDNKQVSRMELWIDGVSVAKSTSGSLKYSWSVKSTSTRTTATTIIVRAYDPSNNVGSKSITAYR
jgi:hypothetical protein